MTEDICLDQDVLRSSRRHVFFVTTVIADIAQVLFACALF